MADIAVALEMRPEEVRAILSRPLRIAQGPRWTESERRERAARALKAARNGVPISDIATAMGASEQWVRSTLTEEAAKAQARRMKAAPGGQ